MAKPKVPVCEKNPSGVKIRVERKSRHAQMLEEMRNFRGQPDDEVDALKRSLLIAQHYLDATKEKKS
jgi:hypothetical protein